MEDIKKLGLKLRTIREMNNLTIRELSKLSGVSNAYISQIETGELNTPASNEKISLIAAALKMSEKEKEELFHLADLIRTPDSIQNMLKYIEETNKYESLINKRIGEKTTDFFEFITTNSTLLDEIDKNFKEIKPLEYYSKIEKLSKEKFDLLQNFINASEKFRKILLSSVELNQMIHNLENSDIILPNILLEKYRSYKEFQKHSKVKSNAEIIPDEELSKGIPVFSYVRAGINGCCELPEPTAFIDIPYIRNGHEVFAVFVKGNSMEPRLFEGDIVVIKKDVMPENKSMGVFIYNDETIVKVYNENPATGEVILTSYNADHYPIVIREHDEFHIVGKVFKIVQNC